MTLIREPKSSIRSGRVAVVSVWHYAHRVMNYLERVRGIAARRLDEDAVDNEVGLRR